MRVYSYLFHLECLGSFIVVDAPAVKEKAQAGDRHPHLVQVLLWPNHHHASSYNHLLPKNFADSEWIWGNNILMIFFTYPLTVALLEFSHLGGLLHSEVDLIWVLPNNLQSSTCIWIDIYVSYKCDILPSAWCIQSLQPSFSAFSLSLLWSKWTCISCISVAFPSILIINILIDHNPINFSMPRCFTGIDERADKYTHLI